MNCKKTRQNNHPILLQGRDNSLVFSATVVCLTKATSPPPWTRHRNAPVYP